MGITGELVRSVFSKSQSIPRHGSEKRKWSRSVRSYLCGDEHSSVLAAEDSTELDSFRSNVATNKSRDVSAAEEESGSVRSSEATVEQPMPLPLPARDDNTTKDQKRNSTYKLFRQEDAAFIIQSAFRNFMARRRAEKGTASLDVQTAHSCKADVRRATCRCRRTGPQVLKIQEDWDDSTVSSVISKMRMQNRLEAATRRERALAYAFSQQLRICSKKPGTGDDQPANMGWSWLERWMAARQPEMNLFQDTAKPMPMEYEKESCGSNDLSSLVEFSFPNKPRPLPKRTFSGHSSTSIHFTPKHSKDVNKAWHVEERNRQKQPAGLTKRDAKNATAIQTSIIGLGA